MGEAVMSVPLVADTTRLRRQLAAILRLCDEVGSAVETALDALGHEDEVEVDDG